MAKTTDPINSPNETFPQSTDSNQGTQKYNNGQMWEVEIVFNNHDEKTGIYILPTHAILEFVIEEDFLDWPFKGYLVYKNIAEGFERNTNANGYYYRMDARDELHISMRPLVDGNIKSNFKPETWDIKLNAIVYDTEDPPSANIMEKVKKIYFWDKKYQLMLDKKIQWSTSTSNNLKYPSLASDSERSMLTGDAIKSLLKEGGFEDNLPKDNLWDKGASKIFYTLPANSNIYNGINHLLKYHTSSLKNDICILNLNRYTNDFELKPLHTFFEKAGKAADQPGELQREHLFFEDQGGTDTENTIPFKAPIGGSTSFERDIKALELSKIIRYQFVDMSGVDNSKALVSKPVYWYNTRLKQFGVDVKENEIQKARETFKDLYVSKLLSDNNNGEPLFTLNDTKTKQYNIEPQFGYAISSMNVTKISREILGLGKILFSGLFLNECISVRLPGSTHRTSGVFVGIDRLSYVNDAQITRFDNKICGQWFVVNVKHIWKNNKFVNDITAIKVNAYESLKIKETGVE